MKKRVFSRDKAFDYFKNEMSEEVLNTCYNGWMKECEGLTKKEIEDIGYHSSREWMVEVECEE